MFAIPFMLSSVSSVQLVSYYDTVFADSPVAWWRFEETSGNFLDEIGSTDLSTSGGILYAQPGGILEGTSVYFDGVNDHATNAITNWRASDTLGTIECWFKTSDTDGSIFSSANGSDALWRWELNIASGKVSLVQVVNGSSFANTTTESFNDGSWHHLAVVSDASTVEIYVDGVNRSQSISTGDTYWLDSQPTTRDYIYLGVARYNLSFVNRWAGYLDELAYYNTVLSPAQIRSHYYAGIGVIINAIPDKGAIQTTAPNKGALTLVN